jgi:hypothetical protein
MDSSRALLLTVGALVVGIVVGAIVFKTPTPTVKPPTPVCALAEEPMKRLITVTVTGGVASPSQVRASYGQQDRVQWVSGDGATYKISFEAAGNPFPKADYTCGPGAPSEEAVPTLEACSAISKTHAYAASREGASAPAPSDTTPSGSPVVIVDP